MNFRHETAPADLPSLLAIAPVRNPWSVSSITARRAGPRAVAAAISSSRQR
ncbi:MAG: hypothetical protein HY815_28385 [Candidatus Riflebacteria bacterium]|nr:hypothetical protein [Candidatus Riflebacteria bacterium]